MADYYQNKLPSLKTIFGTESVSVSNNSILVRGVEYPVVHDVIQLTAHSPEHPEEFAGDIQFTFGEEWKTYSDILPEHEQEFQRYVDLLDIETLRGKRACDLGCGIGRWSYFLKDICKEIVLVDFSDAIYVARKNLENTTNLLYFRGDLKKLPFAPDFCDFLFSLGVLHHLPTPCLDEVRHLKKYAPQLLIYLYYDLDNRPVHYRVLLTLVTFFRRRFSGVRNQTFRKLISLGGALFVYKPLIFLGWLVRPFRLSRHVPLYDFYHDKSLQRIEQDVYDRFFTRIEQRVSRKDIRTLEDTFSNVIVSESVPFWHFLCIR